MCRIKTMGPFMGKVTLENEDKQLLLCPFLDWFNVRLLYVCCNITLNTLFILNSKILPMFAFDKPYRLFDILMKYIEVSYLGKTMVNLALLDKNAQKMRAIQFLIDRCQN